MMVRYRTKVCWAVTLVVSSLFVTSLVSPPQIQFPKPEGYVNDFAGVIDDASKQKITVLATEVKEKTGSEIAVVTMSTIGDEDYQDYANRLFEAWGIGQKGKDNGVLIFNAVGERKVWIEVGYGLEPTITDAYASQVYRELLVPNLRQGRYGDAFYLAVRALAGKIADANGVQITGATRLAPSRSRGSRDGDAFGWIWILIIIFLSMLFGRRGRGRRRGRRSRSSAWYWGAPWFIGGGGRSGGWGGGGGGFGGGFGGFGGGASGGGGAGGGY